MKGVDQEIVDDGGSTQCCDLVERKVCWFWRTKRDFLLVRHILFLNNKGVLLGYLSWIDSNVDTHL